MRSPDLDMLPLILQSALSLVNFFDSLFPRRQSQGLTNNPAHTPMRSALAEDLPPHNPTSTSDKRGLVPFLPTPLRRPSHLLNTYQQFYRIDLCFLQYKKRNCFVSSCARPEWLPRRTATPHYFSNKSVEFRVHLSHECGSDCFNFKRVAIDHTRRTGDVRSQCRRD